jgi:hypothetical protein
MSYDLQVWSVKPFQRSAFRQPETWQEEFSAWTHARKNWQIVVSASDRVVPEDVPEDISKLLPGIEWLTNLNLEGNATAEAIRLTQSTATEIARFSHGAVLDQQDGSIRLPSGVKRLMSPRSKEMFDVVSMSWWFLDSPIESREGREQFLNLLERLLPEALPKRYGSYEPPQHVYAQTGKEHFLKFLDENLHDTTVWYPHRPIVSVHLSLPSPLGAYKLGFRTNHLKIELEKDALSEPGWATNIRRFWEKAPVFIRPIYGDVRVLGKYKWMGASVSAGQEHPVKAWWWAGIPERLGNAVVLGDVYQKLWPAFASASTMINGLAFASLEDWTTSGDLIDKVGRPPQEQVQHLDWFGGVMNMEIYREYLAECRRLGAHNVRRKYPSGWPFGEPFAP